MSTLDDAETREERARRLRETVEPQTRQQYGELGPMVKRLLGEVGEELFGKRLFGLAKGYSISSEYIPPPAYGLRPTGKGYWAVSSKKDPNAAIRVYLYYSNEERFCFWVDTPEGSHILTEDLSEGALRAALRDIVERGA